MSTGWKRVSKSFPCSGCGRSDYCTIAPDGTDCKCTRVASDRPVRERDGTTRWLHRIAGQAAVFAKAIVRAADMPPLTVTECRMLQKRLAAALRSERLEKLAVELGVTGKSLQRLGVGFDDVTVSLDRATGCYSFPMYDGARKPIGFRLRSLNGHSKRCLCHDGKRSRNGLFIPLDYEPQTIPPMLSADDKPQVLLMPEGPTDVAAALDLGFMAVGRVNNNAGATLIMSLLLNSPPQETIIVADRDETHWDDRTGRAYWPGWEGAMALAGFLNKPHVHGTRKVISLKMVGSQAKDLRQWLRDEPQPAMLMHAIVKAPLVNDAWLHQMNAMVEWRRKRESRKVAI